MFVTIKTVAIVIIIFTARISLECFSFSFECLSGVSITLDEVFFFFSLQALLFWRLRDSSMVQSTTAKYVTKGMTVPLTAL